MAVDKIVEELNKLSVLELVELKKALEEAWDVTAAAAAPVVVAGAAPAAGGAGRAPAPSPDGSLAANGKIPAVEKATCIRPFVALRDKPKASSEQHTQVLFADPIDVVGQSNGWAKVVLADGYE